MEQPSIPSASLQTPPNQNNNNKPTKKKRPRAQELISHYQSQGLDFQEASIKVIEDLQNVLVRVISTSDKTKKDKLIAESARKVDVVNNRLAVLDMKVDSKPGFVETFAIGLASGVAFRGIESTWPHVVGGISQIWSAVGTVTKPPTSSS